MKKFIQDEDLYNFRVSSDSPQWTAGVREILGLFLWHWLGVTDYFRPRQWSLGHEGQRAHWLMKWRRWHRGSSAQTYGYMHTQVDPRPEVASRRLSDGLCFFSSPRAQSARTATAISVWDLLKRDGAVMSFICRPPLTFAPRKARNWDKSRWPIECQPA